MANFVHLHVHTEYSLLDGLTKIKKLVSTVKEMGMTSIAITDHGNMYGAVEFFKACKKNDIKPIIGCEVYLAPNGLTDKSAANRRNHHLILLAKNEQGYKNLMKLVSIANIEGYYYKPRIDWETLKKYKDGLVCNSACIEGEIAQLILDDNYEKAKKRAKEFQELFNEDYYLEIQRHPGLKDQDKANNGIIKISRELGIPLVAANDAHYLKKSDAFAQDVLMMINTQTTINDSKRLSMFDVPDFYIKSPEEMEQQFSDVPDALENTVKIAEKCNLEIELGNWYFPKFKLPKDKTAEETLKDLVFKSAEEYYGKLTPEITERLEYELGVINPKGYAAYFLIMRDFIKWTEENNTPTNTRGSAGGCLVAFVLGITSVDPLIYQLPFERFLNKDRPSPPDIDLDIADDKRQGMLYHIIDQYGKDAVAQICTFGRMMAKGAVRDTARVLGYEYTVGDKISKLIPLGSQGFPMSIDKALDTTPELKNLYDTDPDSKKIIEAAKQIEGCARHISVHACAIVISPSAITDFSPVQTETGGDKTITQYEMHACEDVGLIKYDILGIRNLSFLGQSVLNVRKTQNIDVNLRKIPLDDKKTFEMLSSGDTMGVFQLAGEGMTKWIKELKPNRVEDLMAMVALYRPGPMAIIPEYIARKNGTSPISYVDPKMEKFLKNSYGLLVYQDDCLYTAIELAGYNWTEVDKFRKAIGKKIPEEMAAQKEKFIQGCIDNGYTEAKSKEIFSYIEPFTSYGFNKAHAASYGMLAYRTAYMKANYPVEYMCALLTAESGDAEKVTDGVTECRHMGIIISPPDINKSSSGFEMEENPESLEKLAIRFGLSAIKNVGEAAIENIINERNQNGPFLNFNDFCIRVDSQKINKRVLESLIKVGTMDQFGERNAILSSLEKIRIDCEKINAKKNNGQFGLFDAPTAENTKIIAPPDNFPEVIPMSEHDRLGMEKELLGIFVTENPISKILAPFQTLGLIKISEILKKDANASVKMAASLTKFKMIRTKKNNAKMAFLTLEDETGKIEAVIFPKTFEIAESILSENKAYYIEGKTNLREGVLSIMVDTISLEAPENSSKYDFVITVPKSANQNQLMALNSLLKNNPNGHRGLIILPNGKNIPLNYGVNYNKELQEQIDQILA
ncbi:MAG TPA: DNA polymerase III subunit alpha [Candidatus Woesebacteria bacterium]|nr:DNA polymerase III subunit alpha [Candidatus Woesebacteria bacterium]